MGEPKEDSGLIHISFDDNHCIKIEQIAEDVLESHDNLAECYRNMTVEERLSRLPLISRKLEFHPLPDELLRQKIQRYFEIDHARIIGAHHFSKASAECMDTYLSGYFVACTMMTHSINEGILKFVVKRNNIKQDCNEDLLTTIDKLKGKNLLADEAAEASKAIYGSYRNAIHHMREDITKIPDWHEQAKKNLRNLARVESCVFGYDLDNGAVRPHYPQHWDIGKDNLAQAWLRLN